MNMRVALIERYRPDGLKLWTEFRNYLFDSLEIDSSNETVTTCLRLIQTISTMINDDISDMPNVMPLSFTRKEDLYKLSWCVREFKNGVIKQRNVDDFRKSCENAFAALIDNCWNELFRDPKKEPKEKQTRKNRSKNGSHSVHAYQGGLCTPK